MIGKDTSIKLAVAMGIFVLAVVLIDVALFVAWALRKEKVDAGLAKPLFARTWSLVDVWAIGQLAIAVTLGLSIAVMIVVMLATGSIPFGSSKSASGPTLLILVVGLIVQNLMLGGLPLLNIRKRYGIELSSIGIKLLPNRHDLKIGIAAGFALLVASIFVEMGLVGTLNLVIGPAQTAKLAKLTEILTVDSLMKD